MLKTRAAACIALLLGTLGDRRGAGHQGWILPWDTSLKDEHHCQCSLSLVTPCAPAAMGRGPGGQLCC